MQKKLQELTEKIYREGVDKAGKEAEKIVSEAKSQAEEMLSKAKKDATAIIEKAEKEAEELKKNSLNELQLAGKQVISDLKQRITSLVQAKTVEPETKAAFKEVEFTMEVIQLLVDKWDPNSGDNVELNVLLPEAKKKEFEAHFETKAKKFLAKGVEVDFNSKIKGGFKIGPKDGGYLVSFSDEDFDNFFKTYLRPRLIDMLFEKEAKKK